MKNTLILLFGILLMGGCQETSSERYTQNAPEIDLYKKNMADYTSQNWEGLRGYYADTAKLHFNTTESNPISIEESITENMEMAKMLSEYGFIKDSEEYERVITDNDEMWVNYWGTWYGVIAATGQRVEIPVHLTARFVDSLIVREYGYWDSMPFYTAMMEADAGEMETDAAEAEEAVEEEAAGN